MYSIYLIVVKVQQYNFIAKNVQQRVQYIPYNIDWTPKLPRNIDFTQTIQSKPSRSKTVT